MNSRFSNTSDFGGKSWRELWDDWNPGLPKFVENSCWRQGLQQLGIQKNDTLLDSHQDTLVPLFKQGNILALQPGTKVPFLMLQVQEVKRNLTLIVRDFTGATQCFLAPEIHQSIRFYQGTVLIVTNVTVLNNKRLILTKDNIDKVISPF